MGKVSTADRLQEVMRTRGLSQADVLRLIKPLCEKYGVKIGSSGLSQYVTGKVLPGQEKLSVLGMALGVSEAWLMGFDVPMVETPQPADPKTDGLREKLVEMLMSLTPDETRQVIAFVKGLTASRKDPPAPEE